MSATAVPNDERRGPRLPRAVTRDVALGQLGFLFFLIVCVALHPGLVLKANEGGMSNYGVHLKTVFPYTLALLSPALFTQRAAARLHVMSPRQRRFRFLLLTYCVLITLTLLTTYGYTLDTVQKDVHIAVGVLIIVFESGASWWMYRALGRHRDVLVVQLLGLVLAALTFFGALHVLFLSQVVTGGAYAILLVATCRELT
jgi:Domain of unknown function (DUF5009)